MNEWMNWNQSHWQVNSCAIDHRESIRSCLIVYFLFQLTNQPTSKKLAREKERKKSKLESNQIQSQSDQIPFPSNKNNNQFSLSQSLITSQKDDK